MHQVVHRLANEGIAVKLLAEQIIGKAAPKIQDHQVIGEPFAAEFTVDLLAGVGGPRDLFREAEAKLRHQIQDRLLIVRKMPVP